MHDLLVRPKNLDGYFGLLGSVPSPYFPSRGVLVNTVMTLKCFVLSYAPNSANAAVIALLEASDASISAAIQVPITFSYGDTESSIRSSVENTISTYCTGTLSIQAPDFFVWNFTTPTDLAAAIAALPASPSSYETIVSQTGTSAPAVSGSLSPLNSYAGTPTFTWARTSAGVYTLTASSAVFSTAGKTAVILGPLNNLNGQYTAVITSSTVITITTAVQSLALLGLLAFTATPTDAMMTKLAVQVLTYA